MHQVTNPNNDRKTARTSTEQHAAKDPFAQYDHLVQALTDEQQKAIDGGWWLDAGTFIWSGGWWTNIGMFVWSSGWWTSAGMFVWRGGW